MFTVYYFHVLGSLQPYSLQICLGFGFFVGVFLPFAALAPLTATFVACSLV